MKPQVNLKRWSTHLAAAQRQDKSVAAYAAEHGLSRHTLYAAARALRDNTNEHYTQTQTPERGVRAKTSAFSAVRISASMPTPAPDPVPQLKVQLPNGVILYIEGLSTPMHMAALLDTLGALRCSR
ncbi:MAG: hypothetical protein V4858_27865 [Pseudomonadota bacterium]